MDSNTILVLAAKRPYNISQRLYTVNSKINVLKDVNSWSVKNTGTTLCLVNQEPLQPGESKSVSGNEGEIYMGRIDIAFRTQSPAPGTIVNACYVTQKFYMGNPSTP